MSAPSAIVIGAGMVGVSCAIALRERGWSVTLVDRRGPGEETSFGNAGVVARTSVVPLNQPGLWRMLPALLAQRFDGFRLGRAWGWRELRWAKQFLGHANNHDCNATSRALNSLIELSMREHQRLIAATQQSARWRAQGWLYGYQHAVGWHHARRLQQALHDFGIRHKVLDLPALRQLEPAIRAPYACALWVEDAASVDNPGAVVKAYAAHLQSLGGQWRQAEVRALQRASNEQPLCVRLNGGDTLKADHVVVAAGPWSATLLKTVHLDVPLGFERGYHRHYALAAGPRLSRPLYDVAGGFVISPMEQGMRLTTGVELSPRDAPPDPRQIDLAHARAQHVLALGPSLDKTAWMGSRPTLPDSRPAIGASSQVSGLWMAFGHQHIGFSTGPGTGALLAALMNRDVVPIDAAPFAPLRLGV